MDDPAAVDSLWSRIASPAWGILHYPARTAARLRVTVGCISRATRSTCPAPVETKDLCLRRLVWQIQSLGAANVAIAGEFAARLRGGTLRSPFCVDVYVHDVDSRSLAARLAECFAQYHRDAHGQDIDPTCVRTYVEAGSCGLAATILASELEERGLSASEIRAAVSLLQCAKPNATLVHPVVTTIGKVHSEALRVITLRKTSEDYARDARRHQFLLHTAVSVAVDADGEWSFVAEPGAAESLAELTLCPQRASTESVSRSARQLFECLTRASFRLPA